MTLIERLRAAQLRGNANPEDTGAGGLLDQAAGRIAELEAENESRREVEYFLSWRGIERPCPRCGGTGWRCYGSTATWHGGVGGQAMTADVCDTCWGSGDDERPFASHRKMASRLKAAEAALERVREGLRPFAHPDLCKETSSTIQGDDSPVFGRDAALLRLGDFRNARALLEGNDHD